MCNNLYEGCDEPWEASTNDEEYDGRQYYSAAIENFTIKMSHFYQARDFWIEYGDSQYSQSCAQMKGKLVNKNGHTLRHFGNNQTDILSLYDLLHAANVKSLNELSDDPTDLNESYRHAGIVLLLGIDYSNEYSSSISNVEYTYSVTRVPKIEYKVTTTQFINTTQRLVFDRHGVKIFFIFSGEICRFDFQTLLINAVSAIGLLSVATVITDLLMVYVLPLKNMYIRYKYQVTRDHEQLTVRATKTNLLTGVIDENNSDIQSASTHHDDRSPQQTNNDIGGR